MATGNKFGWHSGTLTCKDAKIKGDLYVQDDIVFSDVSAGALGVTGGIDLTGTTSAIGIDLTGSTCTTAQIAVGTSTSARQTIEEAEDFAISIHTTCADTDGANTAKPFYVNAQYTGAGQVGRAGEFVLYPTAKMGGWCNALKGYADFSGDNDGGSTGLASAICAEIKLPNGSCSGAFYPLEIEWVGQTSTSFGTPGTGSQSGLIYINASGTVTDLDDDGNFMSINGLTAGSGHIISADNHTLRCDLSQGTTRYLVFSSAENALTMTGATITAGTLTDGTASMSSGALSAVTTITTSGKCTFGGETDWGTGTSGLDIDGTGYDWVTQTVGHVDAGDLATSCAAAYHALTVTATSHSTTSSFFGTWTELYLADSVDLTGASNVASVWGQVETGAGCTGPDLSDGDFMAAGYFNFKTGATFTTGSYVNGVRIQSEVSSTTYTLTGSTWMAGVEVLAKSGSQNWTYGVKIADSDTGIDIGTATTGMTLTGTVTNGIDLTGATLTQAIDNALISVGSYSNAKAVTVTDNYIPLQIVLTNDGNVDKTLSAAYFKVGTAGSTALMQYVTQMIRMNIDNPTESCYGIQSHLTFGASGTSTTETIGVSASVDNASATPSGLVWGIKSEVKGTNSGTTQAAIFSVTGAGASTQNVRCENLTGSTITSLLHLQNAGTCGDVMLIHGTYSYFANFDDAGTCAATIESSAAATIKAQILVKTPAGATGYINVYGTTGS